MLPIARIGDDCIGICNHGSKCCPHPWKGTIIQGANSVINGTPVARLNDEVITSCPHCGKGTIMDGSNTVLAGGMPIAHITDTIITPAGKGQIVGGSTNVMAS